MADSLSGLEHESLDGAGGGGGGEKAEGQQEGRPGQPLPTPLRCTVTNFSFRMLSLFWNHLVSYLYFGLLPGAVIPDFPPR